MLSAKTLSLLSTLTCRPDAKRQVCILPLASIYWDDELPEVSKFAEFPEVDRTEVLWAFAIRLKLWDHQPLSEDDREFWDNIRSAVPNWAIFRRLDLSEDDRRAREETERTCEKDFEEFLAEADEVTLGEGKHGMQTFSATFRLDKDQPEISERVNKTSWWQRWPLRLLRHYVSRLPTVVFWN